MAGNYGEDGAQARAERRTAERRRLRRQRLPRVLNFKAEGSDLYESNIKAMLTTLGSEALEEEAAGSSTKRLSLP